MGLIQKPWFDATCDANGKCEFTYNEMFFFAGTAYIVFLDSNDLVMYSCYSWNQIVPYLPQNIQPFLGWI